MLIGKKIRNIGLFVAFQIIFTAVSLPLLVFYGPFEKVRNIIVGTSMATFKHQYIAKTFLSETKINEILKEGITEQENIPQQQNFEVVDIEVSDGTKEPEKIDINIEKIELKGRKFKGYALIIKDPKRVKVGYAEKLGLEGQTTSDMAKRYKAAAAVNGGGFGDVSLDGKSGSGIGAVPVGIVVSQGNIVYPNKNIDMNKKFPIMGISEEGMLIVGGAYSLNDIKKMKIKEALSFSPTLIVNGKPYISDYSLQGANPRTAIGQRKDGSIILLAIDGRQGTYFGATLKDLQEVLLDLGAVNAMCLDGGSSTTMYYDGSVINSPCNLMGERYIPTIVYVEP